MGVRSVRITEDIERAIRYVARRDDSEQAQSLRKLARMGFEAYVAGEYRAGEVTLRESAKLLGLGIWDVMDVMQRLGVGGNVTAEEVLKSVDALRAMRR